MRVEESLSLKMNKKATQLWSKSEVFTPACPTNALHALFRSFLERTFTLVCSDDRFDRPRPSAFLLGVMTAIGSYIARGKAVIRDLVRSLLPLPIASHAITWHPLPVGLRRRRSHVTTTGTNTGRTSYAIYWPIGYSRIRILHLQYSLSS